MYFRTLVAGLLAATLANPAMADDVLPTYAIPGYPLSRVPATVNLCPSADGSGTGVPCPKSITTTTAPAVHTQMPDVTIAAGASAVVLTAGQIATGCDVTFTGTTPSYRIAYTTAGAPGTVTATATNGLAPAGAPYHCPVPAPTQGLSVYNSGANALTVSVDRY